MFLYLNEDWQDEWGGQLELWEADDADIRQKLVSISPLMNTMVIFTTSDVSFHGHPDPLRCPPEVTRKSIALYYYTVEQGPDQSAKETMFVLRPGEEHEIHLL